MFRFVGYHRINSHLPSELQRKKTRRLGSEQGTGYTMHKIKIICRECTIVGREKGLHREGGRR